MTTISSSLNVQFMSFGCAVPYQPRFCEVQTWYIINPHGLSNLAFHRLAGMLPTQMTRAFQCSFRRCLLLFSPRGTLSSTFHQNQKCDAYLYPGEVLKAQVLLGCSSSPYPVPLRLSFNQKCAIDGFAGWTSRKHQVCITSS